MKKVILALITIVALLVIAAPPLQAQFNDLDGLFTKEIALKPDTMRYTRNGLSMNTTGYVGGVLFLVNAKCDSGTTPTLNVKVQTANATDSTFADVTGKTMTEITSNDTIRSVNVSARLLKKWTRLVFTVAGTTPKYVVSGVMIGQKRY